MVKNNRTNFEGINEDNAEKARLSRIENDVKHPENEKHRVHGRYESEEQQEAVEANEQTGELENEEPLSDKVKEINDHE